MAYHMVFVLLLIAGLVFYGYGKLLVLGATAFVVATIVPCAIIGIRNGARLEREAREKANGVPVCSGQDNGQTENCATPWLRQFAAHFS
jgi:hypothetical protein